MFAARTVGSFAPSYTGLICTTYKCRGRDRLKRIRWNPNRCQTLLSHMDTAIVGRIKAVNAASAARITCI